MSDCDDIWIEYGDYRTEDNMAGDVNARTLARWIAARLNTPMCAEIEAEARALYAGLPADGPATEFEYMLEIVIDEFGNAASFEHCRVPIGFSRRADHD